MAHVHGAAGAAKLGKSAAKAATQVTTGHEISEMMGKGMSGMVGKGILATGATASVGTHAVRSVMGKLLKHPLVVFGLGVAVGYSVHKYRKEIIGSANRIAEKGKDFVLQQKENLEDLVGGENPETEN